jgi:RNA polymerase sigma-70 factor, ECF subfamily
MTNLPRSRQYLVVALEKSTAATPADPVAPAQPGDCLHAYQHELDYLIGSLRRLGVPTRDLEDVLHEVFLVMLRRWDDYDRERPIRPWLFGIAFRVAAGQKRRGSRELYADTEDAASPGQAPDEACARSEARELLLAALAAIPLERRAVLVMHEVDETPIRDIAEQLEIPLFTAYSRLRKARKELDAALSRSKKGRYRDG